MSNKPKVLIIGSAHVDILGDYDETQANYKDKLGTLTYSIGGSAFNIAANLGRHDISCTLFTVLKKNSLFSDWVINRLKYNQVTPSIVWNDIAVEESGFIAFRKDGELQSAVSSMNLLGNEPYDSELAEKQIDDSSLVVLDCNLSDNWLDPILNYAKEQGKPVFVQAVSEPKSERIMNLLNVSDICIEIFFLNELEARFLFKEKIGILLDQIKQQSDGVSEKQNIVLEGIKTICKQVHSRQVLVTLGKDGYAVLHVDGKVEKYPAPVLNTPIESTLGAGDAFCAAVAHWTCTNISPLVYGNVNIQWESCQSTIKQYITAVFQTPGATVGATIAESGLRMVPQEDMAKVEGFDEAERQRDEAKRERDEAKRKAKLERITSIFIAVCGVLAAVIPLFK